MNSVYSRLIVLTISLVGFLNCYCQVVPSELFVENRINPIGIDQSNPTFTWLLSSDGKNKNQSAYRIQVGRSEKMGSSEIIWDSDKINSHQSVNVEYSGPELQSLKKYYWRVKVWDEKGKSSNWSLTGSWQMGILKPNDWKAKWITVGYKEGPERESPMFRKEITIDKEIESATIAITSHGLYEAYINGKKIGDAFLTPGWTSYNKRLQYQVYDVTSLLKKGKNALGGLLGSGWFRGFLAWGGNKDSYGRELSLLLQLKVNFTDGTSTEIGTDESWKSHKSSITSSEIYKGETIDARKEKNGWKMPNYNDSDWSAAILKSIGYEHLAATYNEPITIHESFDPIKMITTPEGDKVIDFGQNLVGWVEVNLKGSQGDSIVIEHAEVLDKNGNFYTENLRAADQRNTYILNGKDSESFRPHFSWQGFRYIKINGTIDNISEENFKAVALYSNMRKTGQFNSSNTLLNQLQHNIQWGQYGNFLDVPTDCPQRDERLGWTGDAQVFASTAAFNMHVNNFFTKWMKDLEADQLENGSVPFVIPNVLGKNASGSAGWADAATIIPWNMYLLYGNEQILKNQYYSMKSWVDFMKAQSEDDLWKKGFHFGDWLFFRPEDDNDGRSAITDKYLIAQCFYAHSTQILIDTARILGKDNDVNEYERLLEKIKAAFLKEYVTPNGRLVSSSQTAYVLALNFEMLPLNLRKQAVERLVDNIKSYDYHLTTGFLGTPYLNAVLTDNGYHDLAYTLLMQRTYPSWLYPVQTGATTIWERWDGRKPDGTFQTPGMNSFNHYAYGAIGNWMYTALAGINSSRKKGETGYKKIILKPHFKNNYVSDKVSAENDGEMLKKVEASLDTYYGRISSNWEYINDNTILYKIKIPVNTSAEIHLQTGLQNILLEDKSISLSRDVEILKQDMGSTILKIGSGNYVFTIKQ
ncbi:alpha-L-rhamnosidase [Aegicerativicinus sediminis]|uniref:alpha-L-rhamnosidase n=1 Tax=Aegicerativicinus sediminis TaxID=2893202 RepID=UPI001E5DE2DA|nr:alpha-L-rhamnosidase [Aegicerativicinus sediminis]